MLVLSEVSSMNASLASMLRMKGWRWLIQTLRANATSGRFCSTARRSFFVCQAEATQVPPDRDTVDIDAVPFTKLDHKFIKRQVALLLDPPFDPTRHARQLAMPAATALGLGLKQSGRALQQDHVVHELDRNPELRRSSPMGVTFLDKLNDTLTKLHRKWFTHQ